MDYRQNTMTRKINISELKKYLRVDLNSDIVIAGNAMPKTGSEAYFRIAELPGNPDNDKIALPGIYNPENIIRGGGVFSIPGL